MTTIRISILTISDRSFQGERPDLSGPALVREIETLGWELVETVIVPDDFPSICAVLVDWCNADQVDVILTTGGTGFSKRDITPEATLSVVERVIPGFTEAMRYESLKITPHAMLSRAVAGIRNKTMIINLPGSPKAAIENLKVILPVIPHAVQILNDDPLSEIGHTGAVT